MYVIFAQMQLRVINTEIMLCLFIALLFSVAWLRCATPLLTISCSILAIHFLILALHAGLLAGFSAPHS